MRLINRKLKTALLKQGRKLKGTNIFINEHLTKCNADIARKLRFLKKLGKIQNTWTTNWSYRFLQFMTVRENSQMKNKNIDK